MVVLFLFRRILVLVLITTILRTHRIRIVDFTATTGLAHASTAEVEEAMAGADMAGQAAVGQGAVGRGTAGAAMVGKVTAGEVVVGVETEVTR